MPKCNAPGFSHRYNNRAAVDRPAQVRYRPCRSSLWPSWQRPHRLPPYGRTLPCGLSSDGPRRLLSRSDDPRWGVAALCCHRPPFVAETFSAFTVSQRRWDCDIPTVTLALPSATSDRSVFLSLYPHYNFKNTFWPVFGKLFCRMKKNDLPCKPFTKKAAHKLFVPVAFHSAICYTIGVYTTRERK